MAYLEQILILSKTGFQYPQLRQLYEAHSNLDLIQLLNSQRGLQTFDVVLEFLERLIEGPCYSRLFLSSDETLDLIIEDKNERVRALISTCIEHHSYEFAGTLAQLFNAQNVNVLLKIVHVMLKQICDSESEVGLKGLRSFKRVFSPLTVSAIPDLSKVLQQQFLINLLSTGIKLEDSVVRLRFMELIIDLSNIERPIWEAYMASDLMKSVLSVYDTDDILAKLNAIELIQNMGNSQWNAEFLSQQSFLQELLASACNENEDFYLRKYQVLLLSKLIAQRIFPLKLQYEVTLRKVISQWLSSGQAEAEAALEMCGILGQIQEGLQLITQKEELVFKYFSLYHSNNQVFKTKFIASLIGVFKVDNLNPKQPGKMYGLFNLLGNNNLVFDQSTLTKASQAFLKTISIPITESEVLCLQALQVLIGWREILKAFIAHEAIFMDYLFRYSQNKEIFDLKGTVVKDLLYLCDLEQEAVFKDFASKFRERLTQKSDGMMHVETDIQ